MADKKSGPEKVTELKWIFKRGSTRIERDGENDLWVCYGDGVCHKLPAGLFPDIRPGQSVDLQEMFGGEG